MYVCVFFFIFFSITVYHRTFNQNLSQNVKNIFTRMCFSLNVKGTAIAIEGSRRVGHDWGPHTHTQRYSNRVKEPKVTDTSMGWHRTPRRQRRALALGRLDTVHTAETLRVAELDKIQGEKLLRKNEGDQGLGLGWGSEEAEDTQTEATCWERRARVEAGHHSSRCKGRAGDLVKACKKIKKMKTWSPCIQNAYLRNNLWASTFGRVVRVEQVDKWRKWMSGQWVNGGNLAGERKK